MTESTFDPCLLYNCSKEIFGVVGLQIDDTLFIGNKELATMEEKQLCLAKIEAKPRDMLAINSPITFNGGVIIMENHSILLSQSSQYERIKLLSIENGSKEEYVSQRARAAYVATTCQPEASFDLSFAAQITNSVAEDFKCLNRRLQWQINNKNWGLKFEQLNRDSLQIIVFTDSSFANNHDYSSQIGFLSVLTDGSKANLIHWSPVKCQRVTRSVLASELYALVLGFDAGAVIKSTIQRILQKEIPLILCTDSRSLY